MDRAGYFNGMFGRRELNPAQIRANASMGNYGLATTQRNYSLPKNYGKPPTNFMPEVNTIQTRNGVLPCYSQNKYNLRNPPQFDNTHGLQPIVGIGEGQDKGFVNIRPVETPFLLPRSNINAMMPTKIPIPSK